MAPTPTPAPITKPTPKPQRITVCLNVKVDDLDKLRQALKGCGVEVTPAFGGGDGP